uniref:DNA sliding clamp PCNA n=1 Tax=Odontella aurita TaxID=265563 RepID=A0A7S4JDY6_9STRA|mmetsp:Transcript_44605/g.136057  ORF Transcript_44605/g.136057 Transcript_44605/m.136057 type:complete len:260 (+) Transcript_44605:221-1000(+)|eukprot:CAMPEP_0113525586 /NCGR_PEP_ID=MMETSP0015_2-20120614/248_1 /TAXON_ID=2838 /ORGANISM="Odontella" /LENGTH=259 /DNA_ID=CAMNT_0000423777 /DNA_START=143 /DNA_END=922 /DNA_ORIENTATION=+ /assembly_acc=CAM_ASM_000160
MFEARLSQGRIFKSLIDSIKDLVQDANLEVTEDEISIQAMDSSHVSLVAVSLRSGGFDHFRCDRPLSLGFNSQNLAKILKCSGNDDEITLKAEDEGDSLTLMFESGSQDRIADFELKLMDIDSEQLGIPDTEYKCTIKMPSSEFQRIVRDLQVLGDTCVISCTKEGVRFSVSGDLGTGNVLIRNNANAEKEEDQVLVDMEEPVELTFALRYLNFFTKATALGPSVIISMSPDVPIVVEYPIEQSGEIKYYLAPKIDENE